MELVLGPRPHSPRPLALGGGLDLISALPDDLLLLVLACLPCAGAAARTGVLSRRWRGLWAGLRRIVLRDVPFDFLEPVLARVHRPPPTVSLLEIRLLEPQLADTARLNSLLRAAALLDPKEFLFVFPSGLVHGRHGRHVLDLPCFHHATSIVLNLFSPVHSYDNYPIIGRDLPEGVEFPALETLSMSHCYLHDTDALLSRCPRLRTLRLVAVEFNWNGLSVNSPSLEELVVGGTCLNHVNIVAPKLMQLTISFSTDQEYAVNNSISAPKVEKLSWGCHFSKDSMFGLWWLQHLGLQAAERQGQPPSLQIHACIESPPIYFHQGASLTQDIEKRLIAAFSDLELNLDTKGHSYGAFVSHVLEVNQIRCAIQRLKVDLRRSVMEEGCPPDCLCEPMDWKSQTIPLTALEEVDISGFDEKDHGFDFLKLILRSAPMLKRMTIKMSQEASTSNDGFTKVYNIFKDYSSVLCNVYLSSDEYLQHDQHQE
uniref:Uncharacterized protein n=2 Tax=Avena sativa TaxID=4498 RepID=A0ACD5Y9M5_AVESA